MSQATWVIAAAAIAVALGIAIRIERDARQRGRAADERGRLSVDDPRLEDTGGRGHRR